MTKLSLALAGTLCIVGHAVAQMIEAETAPAAGVVKHDPDAHGGEYVAGTDWNPLFRGTPPAARERITVWTRFRGTRVCLKSVDGFGQQTELRWIFKSPSAWTWESFGTFTRAQLGESFLIIRSPGGAENAGLDSVALATTPGFDPNDPDKKISAATGLTQGETNADNSVVKGPAEQEDREEPSAITPAIVMVRANGQQQFTLQFPGGDPGPLAWSVYDAKFQRTAAAGTVNPSGLYTAPAVPGACYVRAVATADSRQSAMASIIVAGGESQMLFREDFNADKAIALVDENYNGVPDYTESGDNKQASKPAPKQADGGAGLKEKQALIAAGGPGGGVSRVDVVSGMADVFPDGFNSNCLLLDDEANWAMGFGVRLGDACLQGTMAFKFYDAGATGNGLYVEMSDVGVEGNNPRTGANSLISLLLKGGAIEFAGRKVPCEPRKVHAVKVAFDQTDLGAGPNGTYSLEVDGAPAGKAAFARAGAPDRLSFHTAIASNMTKGMFFVDDIAVTGIQAPVASRVASIPVQAEVDWSKTMWKAGRNDYSLNAFKGFDPKDSNDLKYQENILRMNPGLLRFHSWRVIDDSNAKSDGWVKIAEKEWDAEKIKRTMDGWSSFYKGDILMNIPGWPTWFKRQGKAALDPSEYDNYARFCADLVRIINVDQKRGVKYWEITNEQDGVYWIDPRKNNEPDNLEALVTIYNKCAEAMKRVDPTIQTGGPAVARGDLFADFRRFIKGTRQNLDFFSYHAYVSGNAGDPDKRIYDKASLGTGFGSTIRKILDEEIPDRHVGLHFNEYNISWSWQINDVRMRDHKGAVFDALILAGVARNGIDASCAWNEKDNTYGKMDAANALRPAAHVFEWFNAHGIGDIVASTSSNEKRVVTFAVKQGRERGLVLINRSPNIQPTQISFGDWRPARVECAQISKDGYAETMPDWSAISADELFLPDHSVTLLSFGE